MQLSSFRKQPQQLPQRLFVAISVSVPIINRDIWTATALPDNVKQSSSLTSLSIDLFNLNKYLKGSATDINYVF